MNGLSTQRLSAAALLGLASGLAAAGTIHVPGDYSDLQAAIDASQNGDEIRIAAGTYTGQFEVIEKQITLIGEGDSTILDGNGGGTTLTLKGDETTGPIARGLTIVGGNANNGGGVFMLGASTLADSTVMLNTAEHGGGAFITGPGVIDNVRFEQNTGVAGGGVSFGVDSTATIIGGAFVMNTADIGGGAYVGPSVMGDTMPVFSGTRFESNSARDGGGLFAMLAGLDLSGLTFVGNSATGDGGAAWLRDLATSMMQQIDARDNHSASRGGSFFVAGESSLHITDSEFVGNSAADSSGGLQVMMPAQVAIGGSTLYDNSPMDVKGSYADLGGNTFNSGPLCPADIALPHGTPDIEDVLVFIDAFVTRDPLADLAAPSGQIDVDDLFTFLGYFISGCN